MSGSLALTFRVLGHPFPHPQFIEGRLEKLNKGEGFSDLFEQEITCSCASSGTLRSYQLWADNLKVVTLNVPPLIFVRLNSPHYAFTDRGGEIEGQRGHRADPVPHSLSGWVGPDTPPYAQASLPWLSLPRKVVVPSCILSRPRPSQLSGTCTAR